MKIETLAKKRRATLPADNSDAYNILQALIKGERVSMMTGFRKFHTVALSQRISELRNKYNWQINDEFVKRNKRRYKEYYL